MLKHLSSTIKFIALFTTNIRWLLDCGNKLGRADAGATLIRLGLKRVKEK